MGKKSDGRVRMTPADQSLYVVVHKVNEPGEWAGTAYAAEYHCASLLLGVRMPGHCSGRLRSLAPQHTLLFRRTSSLTLVALGCAMMLPGG